MYAPTYTPAQEHALATVVASYLASPATPLEAVVVAVAETTGWTLDDAAAALDLELLV